MASPATYAVPVNRPSLQPLPVPAGPDVLSILPRLLAALDGIGPALAPHAVDSPCPPLPDHPGGMPPTLALVVGTSGSTGEPKRALLTASALRASAEATHERLGGPGRWLLAMPAHHIAGLQVLVRSLLAGTEPVVLDLSDGFRVPAFVAATGQLGHHDRNYTALVPTQLRRLLAEPTGVSALQRYDGVLVGGAPAPTNLLDRARAAGAHLITTYGMSETAGGCVYDDTPLRATTVQLDSGGRISLGGPTLAEGYLGEPERTARAFHTDADGTRWFRTDDIGRIDESGLHVLGRIDDVINTGALKVSPRQVEEALTTHVAGIVEAVVVGIDDPDWGQVVSAVAVMTQGFPPPTVSAVRAQLRGILPDHALPQRFLTIDDIPLRGPGKPDRVAVRGLFARTP